MLIIKYIVEFLLDTTRKTYFVSFNLPSDFNQCLLKTQAAPKLSRHQLC